MHYGALRDIKTNTRVLNFRHDWQHFLHDPLPRPAFQPKKNDLHRREGKGCRCCLGVVLECLTRNLAARIIGRTVFWRTSILVGWWFGVEWTGRLSIFPKHPLAKWPLFYSSISSNLPAWCKIASAATNWINSVPPNSRRPFPSLMYKSFVYDSNTLNLGSVFAIVEAIYMAWFTLEFLGTPRSRFIMKQKKLIYS